VIPSGVKVDLPAGEAGKKDLTLSVTGPKGTLTLPLHPNVNLIVSEKEVVVDVKNKTEKRDKALWGLFRSLIENMMQGVTKGFEKKLELTGVGFKVAIVGTKLTLNLGFSHPINLEVPKGLAVAVEKNFMTVSGTDKQRVGQFAAEIRELKKPEPYKGKGIKYIDEVILRKAGKVVKAVGGGK